MSGQAAMAVEQLTKTYRSGHLNELGAADRISLEVRGGRIFGLLGRSGTGKTTLRKKDSRS